jgi:hypothetical protein
VTDVVVVVTARRRKVLCDGFVALGPRYAVVDVAADRRHATAGENAGGVSHLDNAALVTSGTPVSGTAVECLSAVSVDKGVPPFSFHLFVGYSPCDVCDYGHVAG